MAIHFALLAESGGLQIMSCVGSHTYRVMRSSDFCVDDSYVDGIDDVGDVGDMDSVRVVDDVVDTDGDLVGGQYVDCKVRGTEYDRHIRNKVLSNSLRILR